MTADRRDIISWVIERMRAHDDSITQELAAAVEREARAEWGGQRIDYIARNADRRAARRPFDPETRRAAFEAAISTAGPSREVAKAAGVSRATLYRLLKRGPGSSE